MKNHLDETEYGHGPSLDWDVIKMIVQATARAGRAERESPLSSAKKKTQSPTHASWDHSRLERLYVLAFGPSYARKSFVPLCRKVSGVAVARLEEENPSCEDCRELLGLGPYLPKGGDE